MLNKLKINNTIKSLIIILGLMFISSNATAKISDKDQVAVSSYLMGGNINEAINFIEKKIKRNKKEAEWYFLLSDLYAQQNNHKKSIEILETAIQVKRLNDKTKAVYLLANAYFNAGYYQRAEVAYKLLNIYPLEQKCQYAQKLKADSLPYKVTNMGYRINTNFDNIWPSLTADEKNFCTTVVVGKKGFVTNMLKIQEDIYFTTLREDSTWNAIYKMPAPINTRENEGAQKYSADGNYLFFVRCNERGGLGSCDIYYSKKTASGWSDPINAGAPLNTRNWESTPCLSASGKELYFSSNRRGGKGKKDIWVSNVSINNNGNLSFSQPKNLGDSINTKADEIAPFIHLDDSTLYFSSNGHYGLGNHDIFLSKRNADSTYSTPQNMGYPLNSHKDEIGFIVNTKGNKAYLSADRLKEDSPNKDIFEIILPQQVRPNRMISFSGNIKNNINNNALSADIEVFNPENNSTIFSTKSDGQMGYFTAITAPNKTFGFNIIKHGYLMYSDTVKLHTDSIFNIALQPIESGKSFILNNIYFDFDKATIKPQSFSELNKLISFMNSNPATHIEIGGHTDNKGDDTYNKNLSEARAKSVAQYLINSGIKANRITTKGYGESQPIDSNNTDKGRSRNRRIEVKIK